MIMIEMFLLKATGRNSLLGVVMVTLLLAGCSSAPWKPTTTEVALSGVELEKAWETNKRRAQSIKSWQIYGRAGVKTEAKSGAITINWEHRPKSYSIYMTDPLGRTMAHLEGLNETVVLEVPGEDPEMAQSAEALLYSKTGWWLPFSSLRFWMRGIPAPGKDYVRTLNPQGYLAELEQNGWRISYGSYRNISGVKLPEKIKAEKDGVRVMLSIREWTL